jgi:hypothetical protein
MGEHMPDIDLFPVKMNGDNQAIFISRDIENGKVFYLVRREKRDLQFRERGKIGFINDAIPMAQRNSRVGVLASELNQPFSRNDVHTRIIYLDLRYWSSRG